MTKFEIKIEDESIEVDVKGTQYDIVEMIATVLIESETLSGFILAAVEVYNNAKDSE